MCVRTCVFTFLVYIPRNEIASSYDDSNILSNCKLLWKSLHHIVFPPEKYEGPNFSTSLPTLVIVSLFDYRRAYTLRFFFFFFLFGVISRHREVHSHWGPVGLVPPLRHDKPYYGLIFVIVFHSHSLSHMETKFSPCHQNHVWKWLLNP